VFNEALAGQTYNAANVESHHGTVCMHVLVLDDARHKIADMTKHWQIIHETLTEL